MSEEIDVRRTPHEASHGAPPQAGHHSRAELGVTILAERSRDTPSWQRQGPPN